MQPWIAIVLLWGASAEAGEPPCDSSLAAAAAAAVACKDYDFDPQAAIRTAEESIASLACVGEDLDMDSLVLLTQCAGAAAWFLDQAGPTPKRRANEFFKQSAVLGGVSCPGDFISPVKMDCELMITQTNSLPKVVFQAPSILRIDGVRLKQGERIIVIPGEHVVQRRAPGDTWTTELLTIDSSVSATEVEITTPPIPKPAETTSIPDHQPQAVAWYAGGAASTLVGASLLVGARRVHNQLAEDVSNTSKTNPECVTGDPIIDCIKVIPEYRQRRTTGIVLTVGGSLALAGGATSIVHGIRLDATLGAGSVAVGLAGTW